MKLLRTFIVAVSLLTGLTAHAQTRDFGNWSTFSVNKNLNKKLSVGGDLELRFRDNLSRFNLFYINLGATYKVTKWMRVSGVYRFINKYKDDNTFGFRHRLYGDLVLRDKLLDDRLILSARSRMQWEWRAAGYGNEVQGVPEIFWRNKFDVKYGVTDKLFPYVSVETRWQVQNPRFSYNDGYTYDRTRFFLGSDYKITDAITLGLYFMQQREVNVVDPQTLNIIGLEYTISLD
jgi:hypothetical protein